MKQLNDTLERSSDLSKDIETLLDDLTIYEGNRAEVALGMCNISYEHAESLRLLCSAGLFTSGISLLRMQYEALLRACWLWHAATDHQVSRLDSSLTPESQKAAKNLPSVKEMLEKLEVSGPRGAGRLFARFQDRLGQGLNSFVHGGIHPLQRSKNGYPEILLIDLIKNSNGLSLLALLVIAELGDNTELSNSMIKLQEKYGDVLPSLEPFSKY